MSPCSRSSSRPRGTLPRDRRLADRPSVFTPFVFRLCLCAICRRRPQSAHQRSAHLYARDTKSAHARHTPGTRGGASFAVHIARHLRPASVARPLWAIFSFVFVPTAARGLRNTDSTPGPRWLKRLLALVSLPLKLAAGLAWLLYVYVTIPIHPFALLVYEIFRLCTRPSWGAGRAALVQVAPADGGPTIDVKVQGRPTVPASHTTRATTTSSRCTRA